MHGTRFKWFRKENLLLRNVLMILILVSAIGLVVLLAYFYLDDIYLIKTRMEAARKLILQGGMKIGEVAGRCGYSDQHYFSYCFKKYFGVSPVRMRHGEAGGT